MKLLLASLLAGAAAFNFPGGLSLPTAKPSSTSSSGVVATPQRWKTAFGSPDLIAARAAEREAKAEADKAMLVPTPARFMFAFGRPDVLAERRAERLAKWEWSSEFIAKARPDKGNYGAGLLIDDGLTVLERQQIATGREAYLTGGAKLRFKQLQATGGLPSAEPAPAPPKKAFGLF
mmetsp:Transcript_1113/g.3331  ORF Transcript_1113/g.3331 Transcript_1113/m.3331 type:complete len:177 (-) Transcript_1113:52-582(-)